MNQGNDEINCQVYMHWNMVTKFILKVVCSFGFWTFAFSIFTLSKIFNSTTIRFREQFFKFMLLNFTSELGW